MFQIQLVRRDIGIAGQYPVLVQTSDAILVGNRVLCVLTYVRMLLCILHDWQVGTCMHRILQNTVPGCVESDKMDCYTYLPGLSARMRI